jgi:hypothetical protein
MFKKFPHILRICLDTFCAFSIGAKILSVFFQVRRKNKEYAEKSFSTMPGNFKGTVFKK